MEDGNVGISRQIEACKYVYAEFLGSLATWDQPSGFLAPLQAALHKQHTACFVWHDSYPTLSWDVFRVGQLTLKTDEA